MEEERQRERKRIVEENEKMKNMHRTVLDLKHLTEKINTSVKEDISYIDEMVRKGDKDVGEIYRMIRRLQKVNKDSFTFVLFVTVAILGVLLFLGVLFW